ncbi:hypothetical protein ACROYT_G041474 [Oculina patagonica]
MDSKLLVFILCVWLILSDILIDQAEAFNVRRHKGRRRRRRRRRWRSGKSFIPSDADGKRIMTSVVWEIDEDHDNTPKRIKLYG